MQWWRMGVEAVPLRRGSEDVEGGGVELEGTSALAFSYTVVRSMPRAGRAFAAHSSGSHGARRRRGDGSRETVAVARLRASGDALRTGGAKASR